MEMAAKSDFAPVERKSFTVRKLRKARKEKKKTRIIYMRE